MNIKGITITITHNETGELLDEINTTELEKDIQQDIPEYKLTKDEVLVELENRLQSISNWKTANNK